MMPLSPKTLILVGFVLVVVGFVLPFLMVMQVVESTFFLNFISYAASVVGMVLGMIGAVQYYVTHKK